MFGRFVSVGGLRGDRCGECSFVEKRVLWLDVSVLVDFINGRDDVLVIVR